MSIQPAKPSIFALTVTSALSTKKNLFYLTSMECVKSDLERPAGGKNQQGKVHTVYYCAHHGRSEVALLNIHLTSPDFSPKAIMGDTGLLLLSFYKMQSSMRVLLIYSKGALKEDYSSD